MSKSTQKKFETCPMLARSDWGASQINSKGLSHCLSSIQSPVGFHGPTVAGWLVFLNGCHRGEDMRVPVGETKIGSSWQNDCVVTGVGIGSQHAIISLGAGHSKIVSVAENRLIKLNNKLVTNSQSLEDGCLLTLGELNCVFRLADALPPGNHPSLSTLAGNIAAQVLTAETVCGWLVFSRGPCMGQDFRLVQGECRVGSAPGLEVTIPDAKLGAHRFTLGVTKSECKISWIHRDCVVRVNGANAAVNYVLKDSDFIEFDHLEAYIKCLQN